MSPREWQWNIFGLQEGIEEKEDELVDFGHSTVKY